MKVPTNAERRKRSRRGFMHAAGLTSQQVRRATGARGFSESRLLTHWDEVVGPTLAKITRPAKVSFARGGFGATLTILTSGAHAPEVQMQLPDIRTRVNAVYGYNAISRVRITQTDRGAGFAEDQAEFVHEPAELPPEELEALGLDNVKDDGLRIALESLSKSVLTRKK